MNNYAISGLLILTLVSQVGCAADQPKYTSAAELREATKPLLVPVLPTKSPDGGLGKKDREFIVEYLGSKDPEMQNAAADILVKNLLYFQPIRASLFTDYLGATFPASVRAVALSYSFWGATLRGERRPQTDDRFNAMKDVWGSTLNAIAQENGIPEDTWCALVLSMDSAGGSMKVLKLLSDDRKTAFADHLPPLLKGRESWMQSRVISALGALGLDVAVPSLVKWYAQEKDSAARMAAIDNLGLLGISTPSIRVQLKPFLDLATSDSDAQIKAKAQELIR